MDVIKRDIDGHQVALYLAAHRYVVDGRPTRSVTQILKEAEIIDTRWFTEAGRERGQLVHHLIALLESGRIEEATTSRWDLLGYLFAWRLFVHEHKWKSEYVEHVVYDAELDYAGMLDLAGGMAGDRRPWLLDLKTGAHRSWHGLQLAGYDRAADIPNCLRGVVHLRANGRYTLRTSDKHLGDFDDPVWDAYWCGIAGKHAA